MDFSFRKRLDSSLLLLAFILNIALEFYYYLGFLLNIKSYWCHLQCQASLALFSSTYFYAHFGKNSVKIRINSKNAY